VACPSAFGQVLNFSLMVSTVAACLLVAELLLRTVAPVPLDEELEFTQSLPGVQDTVVFERDRQGLRRRNREAWQDDRTLRILCVGGSTTEQVPQSYADTWCATLATELNGRLPEGGEKTSTAAAIFGRGGYRAVDVYDWVERNLDNLAPDLVITLLGVNDLAWNGGPDYRYEGLSAALEVSRARWATDLSLAGRCRERFQLCKRLALLRDQVLSPNDGTQLEWHSQNLPSLRDEYRDRPKVESIARDPDPMDEFEDAVEALVHFVLGRSTPVLLLGQPVLWRNELSEEEQQSLWFTVATSDGPVRAAPAVLADEMDRYNQAQRAIAERSGAAYLDLGSLIPSSLDYFFDDCHFTDKGSRRVAAETAPIAARLLGLDAP
jgi:lysophospholipase L1-like esterase